MFRFRPLTANDFPILLKWLSRNHVKQWWDDGDDTLEKVARHYGAADETARFVLVEANNESEKPIGYFQYYFAAENSIGIDQFIGEEDYLNRGVGTRAIKMFIELIKRKHAPQTIILDPSPENKRAIRCYEKVGFRHYEGGENQTAYMMRLSLD